MLDTAYRFYHSEFDTLREGTIVRDSGFDPRKVVVIFGLGKEGLVGHSVRSGGVATMDAGLLDGILHYQSQTTTHPCIFSQIGTIAALKDPERENKVRQLRQNTVEKVKLFNAIINSCNGINQLAKRGPYAVLEARRSHQLAKSETDRPIVEVFAELGLLGVCGTQFGFDKTVVRLNLGAIPLEEIEPIAKRIHDRFHTAV
ncbi:hypothetical protein EB093_06150 [bacterium]|nr:hypothetical protein [bacterium]